jgi:hypothetical protein
MGKSSLYENFDLDTEERNLISQGDRMFSDAEIAWRSCNPSDIYNSNPTQCNIARTNYYEATDNYKSAIEKIIPDRLPLCSEAQQLPSENRMQACSGAFVSLVDHLKLFEHNNQGLLTSPSTTVPAHFPEEKTPIEVMDIIKHNINKLSQIGVITVDEIMTISKIYIDAVSAQVQTSTPTTGTGAEEFTPFQENQEFSSDLVELTNDNFAEYNCSKVNNSALNNISGINIDLFRDSVIYNTAN